VKSIRSRTTTGTMYSNCPRCGKGKLLVDAYSIDESDQRKELFITDKGPKNKQIVICNLGCGPWEVELTEDGIGFHSVEARPIIPPLE